MSLSFVVQPWLKDVKRSLRKKLINQNILYLLLVYLEFRWVCYIFTGLAFKRNRHICMFSKHNITNPLCFVFRFHLITILVSYVLGCLVCYYVLSSNILYSYVYQLTCHFVNKPLDKEDEVSSDEVSCHVTFVNLTHWVTDSSIHWSP